MDLKINIVVYVRPEGFYANANDGEGSVICSVVQPTVEMALASISSELRSYAERHLETAQAEDHDVVVDEYTQEEDEGDYYDRIAIKYESYHD